MPCSRPWSTTCRVRMSTVLIDDVPFRHNLSGPALKEAQVRITASRCTVYDLLSLLETSIKAGDAAGAERARTMLVTNPASILSSAVAANKKLKPGRRQSLERCLDIPVDLDFTLPFPET